MNRSIDKAFKLWLSEGLLDETQVDALRASLNHAQESKSSPAITIIATFGAVLVGLVVGEVAGWISARLFAELARAESASSVGGWR